MRKLSEKKDCFSIFNFVMMALIFICASNIAQASGGPVNYSQDLIKRMVVAEAQANGVVPPALAMAVAKVESNFQAHVKSSAGARGVMQIMPATANGEFGVGANQLWDPKVNISLGIKYLEKLYRQYDDRWDMALSHYNGGTIKNGRPHSYTRKYVSDVMDQWQMFQRSDVILALADEDQKVTFAKKKSSFTVNKDHLNRKLAEDYWMLNDPRTEKNWKEYLAVADRWLNHDTKGLPAGNIEYLDSYNKSSESFIGGNTAKERFAASLKRLEKLAELGGSGRFN